MTVRSFSPEDQTAFARLSGDYNPLHMDAVAARRLLFGRTVVHGVHLLLWAVDHFLRESSGLRELQSLQADFRRPIGVGESVRYVLSGDEQSHSTITLMTGPSVAVTLRLDWSVVHCAPPLGNGVRPGLPERGACHDRPAETLLRFSGSLPLCFDASTADQLFPCAARRLPSRQIAALLCTTRLVGMECPGRHSLYSQLVGSWNSMTADASDSLEYSVTSYDSRFNVVFMRIASQGFTGNVRAFVRPRPRGQVPYAVAAAAVDRTEFAGERALIVGGSRGLGEVTAKLLAAGGADVRLTYRDGVEEARQIAEEIKGGGGTAHYLRLDVLDRSSWPSALAQWHPTALYYFATPFIPPGETGAFSMERFAGLSNYYVEAFSTLVHQLAPLGLRGVLYPSTVYLDDPPENLSEYVTAKAAGEAMCGVLEKRYPQLAIYRPRLPKMATDQTVSLMSSNDCQPTLGILEHLRTLSQLRGN